ncbi:MAG: hypothetical protein ACK5QX_01950 [bacterium]
MSAGQYVHIESPRFGRTGAGLLPCMRTNQDEAEAEAYALDAPTFVPTGSVRATKTGDYAHTTTVRPGGLL